MPPSPVPDKPTVLVAGEFSLSLSIIHNQLHKLGAGQTLYATNEADAMRLLAAQEVQLVLSDWDPGLIAAIRGTPRLQGLPVVMLVRAGTDRSARLRQLVGHQIGPR